VQQQLKKRQLICYFTGWLVFLQLTWFVTECSWAQSPQWFRHARIAGLSVSGINITDTTMIDWINELQVQGVTAIEADSVLSDYLKKKDFAQQVEIVTRFVKLAHERNMRVVWYIPALEVITANGVFVKESMAREHLDWVQLGFDRKTRAFFYGQKVFWVEPNDESAWMCPNGPYRQYLLDRLKTLAKTGLDALWLDVPILNLVIGRWACADTYCQTKFTQQTGMEFPRKIDFSDPSFFRFVTWRHETLTEFIQDCSRTIKSVAPEILLVAEIVSLDHMGSTIWGPDGTYLKDTHVVWEVDCISDTTGMADAQPIDWFSHMTVYKWCQSALAPKASWAFSYGWRPDDAQMVMANCLAAQINPYEVRVPKMTTTVGKRYRTRMFEWIARNSDSIFESESQAPVGIIYSSKSRDLVDGARSNAYFSTWSRPRRDYRWFASDMEESVMNTEYISEYRGWAKFLIQNNIPFDIVPINKMSLNRLSQFHFLFLPQAATLEKSALELLMKWVRTGGTLAVTGPMSARYKPSGHRRKTSLWSRNFNKGVEVTNLFLDQSQKNWRSTSVGKGKVIYWGKNVGKQYLSDDDPTVAQAALEWLTNRKIQPYLTQNQPIYLQTYRRKKETIVHAVHYGWHQDRTSTAKPLSVSFRIPLSQSSMVSRVLHTWPGEKSPRQIQFVRKDGSVQFEATVNINSLFLLQER